MVQLYARVGEGECEHAKVHRQLDGALELMEGRAVVVQVAGGRPMLAFAALGVVCGGGGYASRRQYRYDEAECERWVEGRADEAEPAWKATEQDVERPVVEPFGGAQGSEAAGEAEADGEADAEEDEEEVPGGGRGESAERRWGGR